MIRSPKVSESIGQIKGQLTVERNVIFNDSDVMTDTTAVIPGDLSEGEKEKVIQVPETNTTHAEEDATENTPLMNLILTISALIQHQTPKNIILYLSHLRQKLPMPCHEILLKNRMSNRL